jgi:hypothetical protein
MQLWIGDMYFTQSLKTSPIWACYEDFPIRYRHRKGRVLNWGSQSITLFNCLLYSGCSGGFATESVSCELLDCDRFIGRTPGTQTQDSVWGSASWWGKEAVCNLRECICPTHAHESTDLGLHWSSKNGGPPLPVGAGGATFNPCHCSGGARHAVRTGHMSCDFTSHGPPLATCPRCSLSLDDQEVCRCVAMVGTVVHAQPSLPWSRWTHLFYPQLWEMWKAMS